MPSPDVRLKELTAAFSDFNKYYSVSGVTLFAPPISVVWDDLVSAVETNGGITPITEIALRFIHRFDKNNMIWFLTMEVCQMDMTTGALIAFGNRFDLVSNSITPSSFTGTYDQVYFDNVLCNGNLMDPNKYINNVVMPWYQQISEIHCQNNLPLADPSSSAVFAPCTFDYSNEIPAKSLVQWPHTIVVFMTANGHGNFVDDALYTQMFTNRAGNMSTMCPPKCNCYDWPSTLPVTATCR